LIILGSSLILKNMEQKTAAWTKAVREKRLVHLQRVSGETFVVVRQGESVKTTTGPDPSEFGKEFFKDLGVGFGVFAVSLIPFLLQIPVLGSPIILLAGPACGLLLCVLHQK
jgi:hypothetical protein